MMQNVPAAKLIAAIACGHKTSNHYPPRVYVNYGTHKKDCAANFDRQNSKFILELALFYDA